MPDDMVNMVIAIHEPLEQGDDDENTAYEMAEDAAEQLTDALRDRLGTGWKATLDV